MKSFVYILAIFDQINETFSFHHNVVEADDESKAYNTGAKWAASEGLLPVKPAHHANDYVIKMDELR
jgi:hypothetical protein